MYNSDGSKDSRSMDLGIHVSVCEDVVGPVGSLRTPAIALADYSGTRRNSLHYLCISPSILQRASFPDLSAHVQQSPSHVLADRWVRDGGGVGIRGVQLVKAMSMRSIVVDTSVPKKRIALKVGAGAFIDFRKVKNVAEEVKESLVEPVVMA